MNGASLRSAGAVKLFNGPLVCPTNGCESVLNSPYGLLFGLPLSLYGMLAYGAVGALAASYIASASDGSAGGAASRRTTLLGLSGGVAALATTSAVLMWVVAGRARGAGWMST
ncbi:hypothetical protein GPECTOR_19g233 [Gonium pectorale]|uniref:Vitamin K epoxide reductase domain-containing protein n=1 Tax=Gonium pectorale TaxID=33097 RepID=A0A150GJ01_GONPE|nr:hypothetical protein GPECTOR_19g233 [Gonium pectorale]|eukprot:KXZ49782.1 hypothetical protein GPECTOR_19g233 [Gonium pectorale]